LCRELVDVFRRTGCVNFAEAFVTSHGKKTVLQSLGLAPPVQTGSIIIETVGERTFEVVYDGKSDLESVTLLNSIHMVVSAIQELKTARRKLGEGAAIWENDHHEVEASGAIITGKMRELMTLAQRVARTNVVVLITGESGTGKEILARAIHTHSPRADKPFIPFNCTAVPRDMLESQLFGHRRGAFTGADRDNPGVIRTARDGTLFLDEIGEMGPDLQPKLLRFLESGEISPLGEPTPSAVDVRIVAATNANLEQLVNDGRFREDLFYRLNVVRLAIPPLRERRDEIPALVQHFVAQAATEFGKGRIETADETLEHLLLYAWPGNVRQLQNEIRRMVALAEPDATLAPDALAPGIPRLMKTSSRSSTAEVCVPLAAKLAPTLARVEGEMIRAALRVSRGRVDPAARALGISRKGLYLKRQRLGL
jgi:hydrogenase-4 transcriptional activator